MLYYYEKRNIDTVDILVKENIRVSRVARFTVNESDGSKHYSTDTVSGSDNLAQATGSLNGRYLSNACATYYQATEFVLRKAPSSTTYHVYYCGYVDDFLYKIIANTRDSGGIIGNVYRTEEQVGEVIEHVIAEEGMYPDDGIQGDYWYVKKSRAINFKYKDSNGIVYDIAEAKYKDVNGNIVDIASAIYKDGSGNILS